MCEVPGSIALLKSTGGVCKFRKIQKYASIIFGIIGRVPGSMRESARKRYRLYFRPCQRFL